VFLLFSLILTDNFLILHFLARQFCYAAVRDGCDGGATDVSETDVSETDDRETDDRETDDRETNRLCGVM